MWIQIDSGYANISIKYISNSNAYSETEDIIIISKKDIYIPFYSPVAIFFMIVRSAKLSLASPIERCARACAVFKFVELASYFSTFAHTHTLTETQTQHKKNVKSVFIVVLCFFSFSHSFCKFYSLTLYFDVFISSSSSFLFVLMMCVLCLCLSVCLGHLTTRSTSHTNWKWNLLYAKIFRFYWLFFLLFEYYIDAKSE